MTASRWLLVCWAALVGLSIGTVVFGAAGLGWGVLAMALAKAWVIADGFMEMRHAPWGWRGALWAWPVVLVVVIGGMQF